MNCDPLLEPFLVQFSNEIDLTAEELELRETRITEVKNETTDDN